MFLAYTKQNADSARTNAVIKNINSNKTVVASNLKASQLLSDTITTDNVNLTLLNGLNINDYKSSSAPVVAPVIYNPSDDIQQVLYDAATHITSILTSVTVLLDGGDYPTTTLIVPSNVNMVGLGSGARFAALTSLQLQDPTDGEGMYIFTNIQFTLTTSTPVDSQVVMPNATTTTIILEKGSQIYSATLDPIIGVNTASTVNLIVRDVNSGFLLPDGGFITNAVGAGLYNIDFGAGTWTIGNITIGGTIEGVMTLNGNNTAAWSDWSDSYTQLNITSTANPPYTVNINKETTACYAVSGTSGSGIYRTYYDSNSYAVLAGAASVQRTIYDSLTAIDMIYTAAMCNNGVIIRDTSGGNLTDTLPTFTDLNNYLVNTPYFSKYYTCTIVNSGANTVTIQAGTSGSLLYSGTIGTTIVIPANQSYTLGIEVDSSTYVFF